MYLILKSWGHEQLTESFIAHDITDLDCLTELLQNGDEAKEVISSVGVRLSLKRKLKEHKERNASVAFEFVGVDETECSTSCPENQPIEVDEKTLIIKELQKERIKAVQKREEDFDEFEVDIVESTEVTTKGNQSKSCLIQNLNVEAVIREHPLGPSIIKVYEVKEELCSVCHSYLSDIIVTHVLKYVASHLDDEDFLILAEKILEIFPNECLKTYFIPPKLKKYSVKNKSEIKRKAC